MGSQSTSDPQTTHFKYKLFLAVSEIIYNKKKERVGEVST